MDPNGGTDAAAMKSFMLSGVHRQVMPSLLEWCDEASVADWFQDSPKPPSWEEAHRRMQHDGRRSKVNHPSEARRNSRFLSRSSGQLGSGPGQKPAFDNAVAHVGCPDLRIDRICMTCCSSFPTFTSRRLNRRDLVYAASATGSL